MVIFSHRGFWKIPNEKNTINAFIESFENGFGVETDIRDQNGKLVIAHDIPYGDEILLEDFLMIHKKYNSLPIALNIKADGLQTLLKDVLKKFEVENYFVFDMSVPETILYLKREFIVFSRQSDVELEPTLYNRVQGIWMDSFFDNWITDDIINTHLENNKFICLVSPELHKRDHKEFWRFLKDSNLYKNVNIMICTDYPDEARQYFENNEVLK
jgi:glycerophosphoryl diester phosphodiesterase